jgi:hypothetical protein
MAFAEIKAHVGHLESSLLKGGTLFRFSLTDWGFTNFWPLVIYSSSYADICACSGVPDIAGIHTNTHRNPNNPNITKGPKIPVLDMIIGERSKPMVLPSWKPAIAIPTALDRSVWGNHL